MCNHEVKRIAARRKLPERGRIEIPIFPAVFKPVADLFPLRFLQRFVRNCLDRLGSPGHALGVSALVMGALFSLVWLALQLPRQTIRLVEKELAGAEQIHGLLEISRTLYHLNAERVSEGAPREDQTSTQQALQSLLAKADAALSPGVRQGENWQGIFLSAPKDEVPSKTGQNVQALILRLILEVADESELTLDPVIDTYYLMDSSLVSLPLLISRLDKLRNEEKNIQQIRQPNVDDLAPLLVQTSLIQEGMQNLKGNLAKVSNAAPSLSGRLADYSLFERKATQAVQQASFLGRMDHAQRRQIDSKKTEAAMESGFEFLMGTLLPSLKGQLIHRRDEAQLSQLSYVVLGGFLMLLLAGMALQLSQRTAALTFENKLRQQSEADLMRAVSEANEANQAKSQFLANMSHEIRTPMNGVIGMAQLLKSTSLTEEQKEYAETIHSSADSLLTIINDILDLSKIEAGKLELEVLAFQPGKILHDLNGVFSRLAASKGIQFSITGQASLPDRLLGDPGRLRQVLNNLLSNASKFTERGGVQLNISCEPIDVAKTVVQISVQDSGIGMSAETLRNLFSVFFQAEASTTRRFGGTGLGLSITKHLVEKMGGALTVCSTEDVGSTFTMRIPFAIDASLPVNSPPPLLSGTMLPKNANVLVVDDNPVNRKVVSSMLSKLGVQSSLAVDGAQAIEALKAGRFDMVLMDCQMPIMDGFVASQAIRSGAAGQEQQSVPIIALTANALIGDREKCLAAGMNDFLSKPIAAADLTQKLAQWLGPADKEESLAAKSG